MTPGDGQAGRDPYRGDVVPGWPGGRVQEGRRAGGPRKRAGGLKQVCFSLG